MKIKTSELTGAALDWAVAKCEGFEPFTDDIWWIIERDGAYIQLPKYASDWAQGGPIIYREDIDLYTSGVWRAEIIRADEVAFSIKGPTPLIAAMRCYVANKLGDEIEVPEELL